MQDFRCLPLVYFSLRRQLDRYFCCHGFNVWERCGSVNYFLLAFFAELPEPSHVPVPSRLMNDREMAICRRLRDLRIQLGWSQTEFAHAVGTTRDQLASIEYGRNPLRFWLADRICEKFETCQQWLESGDEPARGYVRLPSEIGLEIKPNELFSSAWERRVGHFVKERVRKMQAMKEIIASRPDAPEKILENRLYYLTHVACDRIPPELYNDYFDRLMAQTSAFVQSLPAQPSKIPMLSTGKKSEMDLTYVSETVNNVDVKPKLPKLLERLKVATIQRGKKSELAKFLGVSLVQVSQWLTGDREPGGETTLRLLHWVEQQERK